MPAFVLSQNPQTVSRYDVIGVHSSTSPHFVKHVALYSADGGQVNHGEDVDVAHMGPPLQRQGMTTVHAVGTVPLTNNEVKQIETWIDEIVDEYVHPSIATMEQYYIDPPWKDKRDPTTGVRRYRRYSCAGFVLYAYGQVDIPLLVIDRMTLPEVDEQTLRTAYPDLPDSRFLARFGIQGPGPWPIILAGYVLHALDRPENQIRHNPYQPKTGDELF